MKKSLRFLPAIILVVLFAAPAAAQFEGTVTYRTYEYSGNGSPEKQDEFTLFITPDRILLKGNDKYNLMGSIETEGVLVRLDREDFIFLTGDEEALKISKAEIISLMNMFGAASQTGDEEKIHYKKTGETQSVNGYRCEQFIFGTDEDKESQTVVWMTKGIDVNWGMLAEQWGTNSNDFMGDIPVDLVFREHYFPIKVEGFHNGERVTLLEAVKIDPSRVPPAIVNIPSGIQILSFQDYLFRKMSQ